MILKIFDLKNGIRIEWSDSSLVKKQHEDLKAYRHGREFLIQCTHYRDPYFNLTHLLTIAIND